MASRKFYLLPAEHCVEALGLYSIAKEDALAAKRELLGKFGADAFVRSGVNVEALAWRQKPLPLAGFTVPKLDSTQGFWIQKPKKNTLRGKQASLEMDEVGELLELWQWALEHALGVYGNLFGFHRGTRAFLYAVAKPINDGSVVLSLPVRDRMDPERSSGTDPVAPSFAAEIPQAEAERLLGGSIDKIR